MTSRTTRLAFLCTLLVGCDAKSTGETDGPNDSSVEDSGVEDAAGVLRLGPPTPSVGAYGVAATDNAVFISNLHVPFITIIDPQTGAYQDALDLRDLGLLSSFFPQLFTTETSLWVTAFDSDQVGRFDLSGLQAQGTVTLDTKPAGVDATDDGLWLSLQDGKLVRLQDGAIAESLDVGIWASALDVGENAKGERVFGLLDASSRSVSWVDSVGEVQWTAPLSRYEDLNDIAIWGERLVVVDRISGEVVLVDETGVVDKQVTGSDTFGLERYGDDVLVVNRQGKQLPPSGAYEGAPGIVTRLNTELETVWQVEMGKTIHFLAKGGDQYWTANEDELTVSAFDPETGQVTVEGPRIGLTIDHIAFDPSHWWFGSHLTDEIWAVESGAQTLRGGEGATALVADVCSWPFVTVPIDETIWVPCQENGTVVALARDDLSVIDETIVADTFHPACDDGLCTGHARFISGAAVDGALVYTDPRTVSIRSLYSEPVVVGETGTADRIQHFDVIALGDSVLVFEPIAQAIVRLKDGVVVQSVGIDEQAWSFPLVLEKDGSADGDRVWVGKSAFDEALETVAQIDTDGIVAAAGGGWILGVDNRELVVWNSKSLTEEARLEVSDLRVPPFESDKDSIAPLRFAILDESTLLVGNTFRGTFEMRSLPSLDPLGADEVLPLGRWSDLQGLR